MTHEIVFVFDAIPVSWDELNSKLGDAREADGKPLDLRWESPAELVRRRGRFYPEAVVPHVLGLAYLPAHPRRCPLRLPPRRPGARLRGLGCGEAAPLPPLSGGGIEYGETADAAVRREMREELDTELTWPKTPRRPRKPLRVRRPARPRERLCLRSRFVEPEKYESLETFRMADTVAGSMWPGCQFRISATRSPPLVPEAVLGLL
jgi:hypothetical protein